MKNEETLTAAQTQAILDAVCREQEEHTEHLEVVIDDLVNTVEFWKQQAAFWKIEAENKQVIYDSLWERTSHFFK